ncbi:TetR family transcriptional regulator [Plesiomonas shigelloides]|uniref:TetR family transcriptional regulator n=1 Tax=Plesiomonas shigelloides TaxID=703 RepID=UPI001C5B8C79|nr:TetR/AcrR family transcriptional regulator [Plesiomonas shigelloides]MBW3794119.1 TetR/AcrR family transcriptional regulator [Plesiomonas shigelloides]
MQRQQPLQRRSRERVQRILDAAAELFDQKGIDAVNPGDIANHAGITRTSLYRYFPNKTSVIHALALSHLEKLREQFRQVRDQRLDGEELINALLNVHIHFLSKEPGYQAVWSSVAITPELHNLYELENEWLSDVWGNLIIHLNPHFDESRLPTIRRMIPLIVTAVLRDCSRDSEAQLDDYFAELRNMLYLLFGLKSK